MKKYLNDNGINQSNITEDTLIIAAKELLRSLEYMNIDELDVDNFGDINKDIFDCEEKIHKERQVYNALSLICIFLLDLGLIEVENVMMCEE